MAKLDTDRLIRQARELKEAGEELCDRSRHAVEKSKRLKNILAVSHPKSNRPLTRKRRLKRIA